MPENTNLRIGRFSPLPEWFIWLEYCKDKPEAEQIVGHADGETYTLEEMIEKHPAFIASAIRQLIERANT